jgi:cytochrome b involved in lipid metabolism
MPSLLDKLLSLVLSKPLTRFTSYEEIAELAKEQNKILVTINDKVYDLTSYKHHPGGYKVLELCNSKDATEVFKKYHWPQGDSHKIMKKFQIGVLELNLN